MEQADELIDRLFTQHYSMLLRYVVRLGHPPGLAEDLVQDTFLEALRQKEVLVIHPNPAGWLVTTLKFKLRTHCRDMERLRKLFVSPEEVPEIGIDPDYCWKPLLRQVLSDRDYRLLHMLVMDRLSHTEAAALLGITPEACRKRYQRILKKLRVYLTK